MRASGSLSKDAIPFDHVVCVSRELRRAFHELGAAFGFQTLLFVTVSFAETTIITYQLFVARTPRPLHTAAAVIYLLQLYAMLTACQSTMVRNLTCSLLVG